MMQKVALTSSFVTLAVSHTCQGNPFSGSHIGEWASDWCDGHAGTECCWSACYWDATTAYCPSGYYQEYVGSWSRWGCSEMSYSVYCRKGGSEVAILETSTEQRTEVVQATCADQGMNPEFFNLPCCAGLSRNNHGLCWDPSCAQVGQIGSCCQDLYPNRQTGRCQTSTAMVESEVLESTSACAEQGWNPKFVNQPCCAGLSPNSHGLCWDPSCAQVGQIGSCCQDLYPDRETKRCQPSTMMV